MIVLGFDTETKGLDWFDPEQQAFLLSWADDAGSYVCTVDDLAGLRAFEQCVRRADVLVAHNLSFDVHMIRATIGLDLLATGKEIVDTDLLARVVLPERATAAGDDNGYKLKHLAKTYLRADAQAAEDKILELSQAAGITLKSNGGYYDTWRAYPAEMEHYAKLDAEYARDLYPILLAKLDDGRRPCWELEKAMAPVLIRAEQRGVRVDPAIVDQLRAEYEPLRAAAEEIVRTKLPEVNLNSAPQLREALVEMGVPLHRKTDGGELSTAIFALQEFVDDFPVLKALIDWRAADKMLGTYIGPMTGREIVHTSFWQMGARTGRMSCSRPNMQNLPARSEAGDTKLREVFVPREGHCFVVSDYDSIEIRLLAYYLNDVGYREMIDQGLDPHAWMASEIHGGEPSMYLKGTIGEKKRSEAKQVLFAIVYGAGARRVADMLNIPQADAKELVNKIKSTVPRFQDLAQTWPKHKPRGRVPRKILHTGFVTDLFGRKQVIPKDKLYVGLNGLIQGSAASIFKQGMLNVDEALRPLGGHLVLFVHDEAVSEVPLEHAEQALALQNAAMEAAYDLNPALKVSGHICFNSYAEGK